MQTLKAAIFDLGVTLIRTERSKPFQERLLELGVSRNENEIQKAFDFSDKYFMKNYPGELAQNPKDFYRKYLDLMLAYLQIFTISKEELFQSIFKKSPPRSKWVAYDETIPFLKEMKQRGVRLGLLTNWDLDARDTLDSVGITEYFESIVVSSEIGAEKPDPKGFLESLRQLGLSPEEAIYVGDNYYDDVVGANGVGMKAALINRSPFDTEYDAGNYILIHSLQELLSLFS